MNTVENEAMKSRLGVSTRRQLASPISATLTPVTAER